MGRRKRATGCAAAAALLACLGAGTLAQDFPTHVIQLVNPYAAGGPADLLARTIASGMTSRLGRQVVVVNKVGASTAIGANFVAHAAPDGYTLLIAGATTHAIMPVLVPKVGYEGIADFAPVSMVANVPNVLVIRASLPVHSIQELVAYAKANPGKLNFASVGVGSQPHLAGELFKQMTGVDIVHVPYTGAAPATTDLLAGTMDLGFLNAPQLLPHIQSGALRALAVTTLKRAAQLPDVPTLDELGLKGFDIGTWYGISAPVRTPQPVVAKLADTIAQVLRTLAMADKITSQGAEIFLLGPDAFATYLRKDAARMAQVIKTAHIHIE
ncbi:MAG TPA: tripartite tricarboxylate transporter substrate binding protein [Xanthobacteraceae bacterium]|nr:tripartite tricarboxylate transporter substrate binding protein [Xanthobacteraceae bacterium]